MGHDHSTTQESPTERAKAAVERWCRWMFRNEVPQGMPIDQIVFSVVEAYAEALTPDREWFPIASVPEGEHVMLFWPEGEKGVGGIECATVYRNDDSIFSPCGYNFWTHGGPNAGSDWSTKEAPTLWMPLPKKPGDVQP